MSCSSTFVWLKRKVVNHHELYFCPILCKSWSCPKCRQIKAIQLCNYIREHFNKPKLFMLTFTFFHTGDPLDAWKSIGERWNRFRTYASTKHGRFSYLRVVEPHKDGHWPHLHVLVDKFICDTETLQYLTQQGFGWNFSSICIDPASAAHYVSHYLTKSWPSNYDDAYRQKSGVRICCVSHDLPAIFNKKSDWEVEEFDIPAESALAYLNALISILRSRQATFICSRRFGAGFILSSDLELSEQDIAGISDPYQWVHAVDFEYERAPYGIQQELLR